jgi:chromosome partitioning protein
MKIIALSNQKGGVGKTTSAVNIGAALARQGKRVILVDLDSQGNMTQGLGIENPDFTINGLLFHGQEIHAYPVTDNLVLVATDGSLSNFDKNVQDKIQREFILKKALEPLKAKSDYIILDCPPMLGLVTINAFTFADEIYVPVEAQKYSIEGLAKVFEMVTAVREINPGLKVKGIFFTRHNHHKILNRDVEEYIRNTYGDVVMQTYIRENVALRESPHANEDIFRYAPESNGAEDYLNLTQEILSK